MVVSSSAFPQKSDFNYRLKFLLRKLGLFPVSHAVYQKLSPAHRRDRFLNRRFYGQIVRRGDLCFDIGANVGQTVDALLQADAVVVAVEPNPSCLPVLDYYFRHNRSVTIVNKALGASAGSGELHYTEAETTASMRADWPFPNRNVLEVEITTVDALIAEFGVPQLLKVDVEGFELQVFKGLSQPIPLIYFEMHSHETDLAEAILDRLSQIGEIVDVNVISGDHSRWLMDRSVSHDEFLARLVQPLPRYANVLVRMNS